MHSNHILHRDLKPNNIFVLSNVDPTGCDVKIGDFGLSTIDETIPGQDKYSVNVPMLVRSYGLLLSNTTKINIVLK